MTLYKPLQAVYITFSRPGYGAYEWSFHLFGRHHCKSKIFERMENFQNDCCRPCTKKPFKNSYSRQLRIVNAWLVDHQQVRSVDQNLFFSKIKLLFLRRWRQLWLKSTERKQRYRINFFVMFRLSVLLLNSMSKLIHKLLKLYGYIRISSRNEQLRLCFYVLIPYSLLFSSEIILKQLFASGSVNIVE